MLSVVSSAQKPVVLTEYISLEPINDFQIYYYSDPSCLLTAPAAFSPQLASKFNELDFSRSDLDLIDLKSGQCAWFRFIFANKSTDQVVFVLQPNIFSTFGRFDLYQRFENGVITERNSGFLLEPKLKDINISGSDDLKFFIRPSVTDTVYLKVTLIEESVISDLTFSVSTFDSVFKKDKSRRLVFGLFLGIMIIMILYHIPIFLQIREISYLYFILYIIAFTLFFVNKEGYIYELTPQFTAAPVNTFLLQVFLLMFVIFGRAYIDTAKNLKAWDKVLLIAIGFIIAGLFLSVIMIALESGGYFIPYSIQVLALSMNIISALASMFLVILPAFILKKKRFQPARYFLIANAFLILGIAWLFLLNDFTFGKHGLEIGVTLQVMTFSVGLGEKINLLKRDRELAQRRIIDQLRENAALKDKVNRELEDKVKERTREIRMQKEQIEKQNREIKYSFDYAKRIQSTVLPPDEVFESLFAEHFIFFKPRDIVSGDFYWISQRGSKIFITASDCTGHGVPGSLMSMLGITMLHEIVNEKDINRSDMILNELRLNIARTLKQEGKPGEQKDGMDMVMLIYDRTSRILEFSGANNPLYIIRDKEMIEYKGNNMPVAYYDNMTDFSRHTIQMKQGDRVYLFTDGFPDQFGGPEGKKFKYKPFKELLLEMHDRPMEDQEKILRMIFDEWKGDLDQIDDVLVIGLRF
jgi:serine phosphatase RsbU (regulator of sigma subunit)